MENLCGANCKECNFRNDCKGCLATKGKPFGGKCIAAEYIKAGGKKAFEMFKKQIIAEFNALNIEGMPKIDNLYCLCGFFVNLEYPLPNGKTVKLLDDKQVYLGTQAVSMFADECNIERCFGLVAGADFLLVSEYGVNGSDPELIMYKKR